MSMQYVRDQYGVPAKRGRHVEVYFRRGGEWSLAIKGRITSATYNILIRGTYHNDDGSVAYEGERMRCHPTYGVVYFEEEGGAVLMDTREIA